MKPQPTVANMHLSISFLLTALLAFTNVVKAETGIAEVMSALYIDNRDLQCDRIHIGKDFIYLSPSEEITNTTAWSQVVEGPDLTSKYNVRSGDRIRVTYKNTTNSTTGSRRLLLTPDEDLVSIDVLQTAVPHEIFTGTQIRVRSMIYIIKTCGWEASANVTQIQNMYFQAANSISGYHTNCTYGKVTFNSSDSIVFGPVEVPCNGTVSNGILTYNFDASINCGSAEQFAWRTYAENAARAAGHGAFMDAAPRRRIVHILPREVKCPWAGLGSVGCGGSTCTVYIKGAYALSLTVNMHELGHTQGLSHAGRGYDEYGDYSDVMGTASSEGYLCMNVGNQFRVGWNTMLANLNTVTTNNPGNTGLVGRWVIPATNLTENNALFLNYSTPTVRFPNMFVSFRTRGPLYDNVMPTNLMDQVFVHQFNGTASERDYNRTLLVATLVTNGVYTSPFVDRYPDTTSGGGVKIRVVSITPGVSATVQLCHFTQLNETTCNDGIDNDCDGIIDNCVPPASVSPVVYSSPQLSSLSPTPTPPPPSPPLRSPPKSPPSPPPSPAPRPPPKSPPSPPPSPAPRPPPKSPPIPKLKSPLPRPSPRRPPPSPRPPKASPPPRPSVRKPPPKSTATSRPPPS
ncbi:hypothetical protein VaNZ11_015360 [Volvox africanus]|uniref:Peptidase M11 gametolysin domain-containing protein n=1 Tax=Volvox africanus TaxID=51714 RepID=A0ABQ5SM27_9CHLO|nr:hypothetical protein VaNZ11_015360 [Volvox africanus]